LRKLKLGNGEKIEFHETVLGQRVGKQREIEGGKGGIWVGKKGREGLEEMKEFGRVLKD
jgi:hypothetical protein